MECKLRDSEWKNKELLQAAYETVKAFPKSYYITVDRGTFHIKYSLYHKDKYDNHELLNSIKLQLVNNFKWKWLRG